MNPLYLRAINLRSYPSIDWRIPEGITAIIGSNGAGKSTLLAGIELALFADGSRDLAPALGPFGDKLEIALEFEHDGETYRVRRGYAKSKATLDLEQVFHGNDATSGWLPLNRESVRETQALLEATLGLSRETFAASAFLAQGDSAAFCEAAPAERKAILGAILDPRALWPALAQRAAGERKAAEAELAGIQARIADREPLAAQVPELWRALDQAGIGVQQAAAMHEQAQRALEAALAAEARNEAAAERARGAEQAAKTARVAQSNAADLLRDSRHEADQLPHAQAALATLSAQEAEIPALERQAEAQRGAEAAREQARRGREAAELLAEEKARAWRGAAGAAQTLAAQHSELLNRISHLRSAKAGEETCAVCKQHLGVEAREASILTLEAEAAPLLARVAEARQAADDAGAERAKAEAAARAISIPEAAYDSTLAQRLTSARHAAQERAGLAVRIQSYEAAAERLPALTQAHVDAERALFDAEAALELAEAAQVDPETLDRATAAARLTASNRRIDLDEASAALTRTQITLDQAKQAAAEIEEFQEEAATLYANLDTLRIAELATGRDGIPALIAENTCAAIEAEANRVLERIPTASGTTFRVELRTQRTLKGDASALRETLDILVADRQTTREFATFSGGERFRVAFALRWSLARLLAGRRGAESRLLVIDEPDGLDAGGMDGLAAVLREDASSFARVLLVSHNPLLASAFAQVVEVESDGEVSRIKEDV